MCNYTTLGNVGGPDAQEEDRAQDVEQAWDVAAVQRAQIVLRMALSLPVPLRVSA